MNYKRKGPKSTRAGCLLCKSHKVMGNRKKALPVHRLRALYEPSSSMRDLI